MCSSWRRFSRWMAAQISGSTWATVDWVRSNMAGSPLSAEVPGAGRRADAVAGLPRRTADPAPAAAGSDRASRWFTTSGPRAGPLSPVARRRQCSGGAPALQRSEATLLRRLRRRVPAPRPAAAAASLRGRGGRRHGADAAISGDVGRHRLAAGHQAQVALLGQHLAGVAAVVVAGWPRRRSSAGRPPGCRRARCTP